MLNNLHTTGAGVGAGVGAGTNTTQTVRRQPIACTHPATIPWSNNNEVVCRIVIESYCCKQNGGALAYASAELRGDREVVLAAVNQYGGALQFASAELRGDREVVLAAVKQYGEALDFVSMELRGDRFVEAVAERDVEAARNYVKELGSTRPFEEAHRDKVADKIVDVVKYFPALEQEAQDASASLENPLDVDGNYSRAHKRSRAAFEADMDEGATV